LLQCNARADGSLSASLTLNPGVSSKFAENDVFLLSRDRPEVSAHSKRCSCSHQALR
jgi:hypothetical protein